MRRVAVPLLVVAFLAGSATAATIRGSARSDLLRGTPAADRIAAGAGNDRIDVAFGGTDRVSCGAGNDLVVADRRDRIARDCETVVRRLSTDPFTDPTSSHETAVEPDAAAWGSSIVAAFQVGRFRGGGANGIGLAVSRDAGQTWSVGALPGLTVSSSPAGPEARVSDPAVAYDALHHTWLVATLGITGETAVLVSRSPDGRYWGTPVQAATGASLDKEWIACDNGSTSPFLGRCYLAYTDDKSNQMLLQTSTDGGLTWSTPVRIGGPMLGAQPVVRPDGSLVVVAADIADNSHRGAIVAFRSDDGGSTFAATTVALIAWHHPHGMRAAPLPSAAAGPDGVVYAAWSACAAAPDCAANDVVVSRSADGSTWTTPVPVTHGGTDHFITGLAADPGQPGRVAVVYALFQPGSCERGTCRVGAAFTRSNDGGATWQQPIRLDAAPFPETWLPDSGGRMVGDYYSTAFAAGRAVAVFALAEEPLKGRLREGVFAASLPGG